MRYNRYTTIGFAETSQQWHLLVEYRAKSYNDLQIVAVTPEVDYLARYSGEVYLVIEDFYRWNQLDALGEENIDVAEKLFDEIDLIMSRVIGELPGSDLVTSKALFHPVKGFLDSIAMRMFPVETVFEFVKPSLVLCFVQPEYEIKGGNLLDKPPLSLTSRIVPLVAETCNCRVEWINTGIGSSPNNIPLRSASDINMACLKAEFDRKVATIKQSMMYYLPPNIFRSNRRLLFSSSGLDGFTERILSYFGKFAQTGFVDIGELYGGNKQINAGIVSKFLGETGQILWKLIDESLSIRELLVVRGRDIYFLVKSLLRLLISEDLLYLISIAVFAQANMKHLKNSVVMTGGMMSQNTVIARACSRYSIPMVSTHRGGFLGYCYTPFHERYEMADADYYISGGRGATETFSKPSDGARWRPERKRAKPVTLGQTWLDVLVEKYRKPQTTNITINPDGISKRKKIMYVMSALLGDNCYIGHIFHPEIWLWRFQAELISFLSGFQDVDVILKAPLKGRYPQIRNPVFDWMNDQGFRNITVYSEDIQLENIISLADAFIIDSPSTPLWPLSCTDKPFLAYIDKSFFRLVPKAKELLAKRAILSETKGQFLDKLESFLKNTNWTVGKSVNDEFLHHFGTHLNDGKSAERTASFLFKLASRESIEEYL